MERRALLAAHPGLADVCAPPRLQASLRGSLRRAFGGWELLLFGIGIVIGNGVYSSTGATGWCAAGPAIFLAYLISGISALCAAWIYGEFVMVRGRGGAGRVEGAG